MIETVYTERAGERQEHQDVSIDVGNNVSAEVFDGALILTLTGTRRDMKAMLRKLAKNIEAASK